MPSRLERGSLACPVSYLRSLPDVGLGISISYAPSFDAFDLKDVSLQISFAYRVRCAQAAEYAYA